MNSYGRDIDLPAIANLANPPRPDSGRTARAKAAPSPAEILYPEAPKLRPVRRAPAAEQRRADGTVARFAGAAKARRDEEVARKERAFAYLRGTESGEALPAGLTGAFDEGTLKALDDYARALRRGKPVGNVNSRLFRRLDDLPDSVLARDDLQARRAELSDTGYTVLRKKQDEIWRKLADPETIPGAEVKSGTSLEYCLLENEKERGWFHRRHDGAREAFADSVRARVAALEKAKGAKLSPGEMQRVIEIVNLTGDAKASPGASAPGQGGRRKAENEDAGDNGGAGESERRAPRGGIFPFFGLDGDADESPREREQRRQQRVNAAIEKFRKIYPGRDLDGRVRKILAQDGKEGRDAPFLERYRARHPEEDELLDDELVSKLYADYRDKEDGGITRAQFVAAIGYERKPHEARKQDRYDRVTSLEEAIGHRLDAGTKKILLSLRANFAAKNGEMLEAFSKIDGVAFDFEKDGPITPLLDVLHPNVGEEARQYLDVPDEIRLYAEGDAGERVEIR